MKEYWKKVEEFFKANKILSIVSLVFALSPAVFLFASWFFLFEKMFYTETYMPALVGVGVFVAFAIWTVNLLWWRKKFMLWFSLVWGALSFFGIFALLATALSKFSYFFIAGAPYFVCGLLIILVIIAWCGGIRFHLNKIGYTVFCVIFTLAVIFASIFGVFNLQPVYYKSDAVVFAVENEYQICWSTSTTTTGYVQIGEKVYSDSDAGALHVAITHKVIVPREALDTQKSYTVISSGVAINRAYLISKTSTVQKQYSFRPVDTSDGFQIYNMSDNHLFKGAAIRASQYWGDKLDLLIANGDLINDVSDEWQITNIYDVLARITGSSRHVIISRGNHEAYGSDLANLHRYFGSYDGKFYYTVRFDDTAFIVFDLGNDQKSSSPIMSTTYDFDEYRHTESSWLENLVAHNTWQADGINHIVAVCHIPFPINLEKYFGNVSRGMMQQLEAANIDVMLAGHRHKLRYYEPHADGSEANFPIVLGSIRSDGDPDHESLGGTRFTGTAIQIDGTDIDIWFTNSQQEVCASFSL